MANTLSIDQIGVLIQAVAEQATGRSVMAPTNTKDFVAVAQTALLAGREAVMNAISQLLSRTIYARRDEYRGALDILVMNEQAYGNHIRKISAIDTDFEEDPHYNLTDGSSIDQYTIRKPKAIQTNFYGGQTWMKSLTIFSDQVDTAMILLQQQCKSVCTIQGASGRQRMACRPSAEGTFQTVRTVRYRYPW